MLSWVLYAGIGKIGLFLWMKFPLPEKIEKNKFIKNLHECGLCSGTWLYPALALFMKVDLLSELGFWYIPFLSEVVTGVVTTFVVHLISLGWNEQFNVTVI